jgi:hypothetical protein
MMLTGGGAIYSKQLVTFTQTPIFANEIQDHSALKKLSFL